MKVISYLGSSQLLTKPLFNIKQSVDIKVLNTFIRQTKSLTVYSERVLNRTDNLNIYNTTTHSHNLCFRSRKNRLLINCLVTSSKNTVRI